MSLFSIVGLYEEIALQGSFRGIGFAYVSGDDEPGRRVQSFLFPGQDVRAFQDLGVDDGDIVVNGIISGDDYVAQAQALRQAFWTPGPGTLVHPWLGTLQVEQKPGRKPKISFRADALRIATFTAVFLRYQPPPVPTPNLLTDVLGALSDLRTAAYQMLAAVLAPVALTLTAVSQVESLAGEVSSILGSLVAPCSAPQVGVAAAQPIALLTNINGAPLDGTYAATVGELLAAPGDAIATTTTPAVPAAVAPGGPITTPVPVDGRITAQLLLSAIGALNSVTLTGAPIQIPPGPALILCAQVCLLGSATSAASDIAFTSQQEAMSWRDQIAAAIDAATLAAAAQVPTTAAAASALWRGLIALRASWFADMNGLIGSLPAVVTFTPPAPAPVWRLANYLAGGDTTKVVPIYRDLIARNGIVHPGAPVPGPLEVLA